MRNNVYILFRPWNLVPCYVGKGCGNRWLVHEKSKCSGKNPRLVNIMKKAGVPLPKIKIAQDLTEKEAFELERFWISKIGRGKNGPLVNCTDGGEGTSGIVISLERRLATSRRHKGKKLSPEHTAALVKAAAERIWSEESLQKLRRKRKKRSPQQVEEMRQNTRLQMQNPEMREAVAQANRTRIWTLEMRIAHGKRMKEVAEQKRAKAA